MGILIWLHKRRARGITRAMLRHYTQGKALHPKMDEPALCRDVIGSRYQLLSASPQEHATISSSILAVANISQACLLVTRAETDISIAKDNALWVALSVAIATQIHTSLGSPSGKDINVAAGELIKFAYDVEERLNRNA